MIGLPEIGISASALLLISIVINIFIQVLFCSVLYEEEEFTGNVYPQLREDMALWRMKTGHDESEMDMTSTSLVSRVCNGDGSLAVAGSQITLVGEINKFLGLKVEEFDYSQSENMGLYENMKKYIPGPLLCFVCVILWTLIILKEYRRIFMILRAAFLCPEPYELIWFE